MKQNEILNNFNFTINHLKDKNEILKDKNEILKDKVKHLESFNEMIFRHGSDWIDSKLSLCDVWRDGYGEAYFEAYNHKTKRNKNGNLITYYTK